MKKLVLIILLLIPLYSFSIKPDTVYSCYPNVYGLIFKEFRVKTYDNVIINAWFYPAQDTLPLDSVKFYFENRQMMRPFSSTDTLQKPTIIICNGDAGNMSQLIGYAYQLCTRGFNVVTFDWRGFGGSQKWNYDKDLLVSETFISDYNAIIDTVINLKTVNPHKIGAFGFSTGAYISFLLFEKRIEIKALACRGMFTSYAEALDNLKHIFPNRKFHYPTLFDSNDYSAKFIASNISKPTFLIVGRDDDRTPPKMSIELLTSINSSIRELWIVDKAAHGGAESPEVVDYINFYNRISRFYKENL